MSEPLLEISALDVGYGQAQVLHGVDLTMSQEAVSVIGRNGMGKTTLCNAIMGLLPVMDGSIRFRGLDLVGLPPYKIAASGIGYVPTIPGHRSDGSPVSDSWRCRASALREALWKWPPSRAGIARAQAAPGLPFLSAWRCCAGWRRSPGTIPDAPR